MGATIHNKNQQIEKVEKLIKTHHKLENTASIELHILYKIFDAIKSGQDIDVLVRHLIADRKALVRYNIDRQEFLTKYLKELKGVK